MPIDYATLKNWSFADIVQSYSNRDTILYSLGLGFGVDATDPHHLQFVYEKGLRTFPTMGAILANMASWIFDPRAGVDLKTLLHGEQSLILHRPLPTSGTVVGRGRMLEVYDKGPGNAALAYFACDVSEQGSDEVLCTSTMCFFFRGAGGFGGATGTPPTPPPVPGRAPDLTCDIATFPQQALLYRLSGDVYPLHVDPAFARAAGFERPTLHGMCTYGIAARALVQTLCDHDPARLKRIDVRFSAPVYPGERVHTDIWRTEAGTAAFRCTATERNVIVVNNGYAKFG